ARTHRFHRKSECLFVATRLEHVIGSAPSSQAAQLFQASLGRSIHPRVRAKDFRTVELGIAYIDGDDKSGPRERRALNHIESHRAAADDNDTGPWRDRRLPCGRAHSGHDAATDQAGAIEWNPLWHNN